MSSQYSDISKKIGWSGTASIPTIAEAEALHARVKKHDAAAYEQGFIIHRVAASPTMPEHRKALSIIYDAWMIGTKYFQGQSGNKQVSYDL